MIIEPIEGTKVYLGGDLSLTTSLSAERVSLEAHYVGELFRLGRKVEAIRHARDVLKTRLREAKYFAEQAGRGEVRLGEVNL